MDLMGIYFSGQFLIAAVFPESLKTFLFHADPWYDFK